MIFPCSDFRHAVMTPAILLISEYLMRCPITSGRDIAIGTFLCSMVLSVSIIYLTLSSFFLCLICIIYIIYEPLKSRTLSFKLSTYNRELLQVSGQSQKFCPEAITFLQTMLMAALTNRQRYEASQVFFP